MSCVYHASNNISGSGRTADGAQQGGETNLYAKSHVIIKDATVIKVVLPKIIKIQ